jgi:hypothetical protein
VKTFAALTFALMAGAAAAQSTPRQTAPDNDNIVVTGVRLSDAKRRLEECLARKCPPLEDIAATLQYAEALFVGGDYSRARSVVRSSLGRNREEAKTYPNSVAGLYRAHARISIHFGDGEAYRSSTYGAVRSLKAGLEDLDPRILGARLEAAEMHASLNEIETADGLYRSVAKQARRIDRPDIAAMADLRRAWMDHHRGLSNGRKGIEAIANSTEPRARIQRLAAKVMLARIDRVEGLLTSADDVIAEISAAGFGSPTLIYQPPIEGPSAAEVPSGGGIGAAGGSNNMPTRSVANAAANEGFDYWVDIGFWVRADGRVEDVDILRSKGPTFWTAGVLRSIAGRLYAPAGAAGASDANYRVERYSFTSLLEQRTDSRILVHSSQGRIEQLDLTPDRKTAPPQPQH